MICCILVIVLIYLTLASLFCGEGPRLYRGFLKGLWEVLGWEF